MRIQRSTIVALVLLFGCDAKETVAETPAQSKDALPASAIAPEQSAYVAVGRVDLQAVVDGVADGSIKSAAELETKLSSDTMASVDLDADGERDELRIVEKRAEKSTVFEIHALPSAKVKAAAAAKAEADIDIEVAPVIAELRLDAHADAGKAIARASFSQSFVASAKITANVEVEHTFTGVSVSADGLMQVDGEANAFVAWTFRPRRPLFVAEVFVVAHASTPEPDPCWPPGHCKHGFWKATGEDPPGHERKHDDDRDDVGAKKHDGDHGKPNDAGAKKHDDDHGKPKPASDKGKPDKGHADKGHADKGNKGGADKGGGKGKGK
ncbi:MAG TPA: hypothetical protein VG755_06625 [Nannocystaceae bacterium]|nr:hypothetical protein [Nannocystaceae bacterium]